MRVTQKTLLLSLGAVVACKVVLSCIHFVWEPEIFSEADAKTVPEELLRDIVREPEKEAD